MRSNGGSRLNAAYLERKLRAAVGLVGAEVLREFSDLNGIICLESDRPEWRAAANDFYASQFSFQGPGGAGNVSVVGLRNPVDSGQVAVIQRMYAETDPATPIPGRGIEIALGSALVGNRAKVYRDLRIAGAIAFGGVEMVSSNNQTIAALSLVTISFFNPVVESYQQPIILAPGRDVYMIGLDAAGARRTNIALYGVIDWYVRPLEGNWEIK